MKAFEDAFNLLCGKRLGGGIHRDVFTCKLRPDCVVKVEIEQDLRTFANLQEWLFWENFQHDKKVAEWLAPIEYVSPDARILLQKRAEPLTQSEELPATVPAFLTDLKRENFGRIDGKIVCVDYAFQITLASTRHKKAIWSE